MRLGLTGGSAAGASATAAAAFFVTRFGLAGASVVSASAATGSPASTAAAAFFVTRFGLAGASTTSAEAVAAAASAAIRASAASDSAAAAAALASATDTSLRMSMRQPLSRAARRAFWPSRPIASESIRSGTVTLAMRCSSSISTDRTWAGLRALATKTPGSSLHGITSIFSPASSATTAWTRAPR